MVKLSMIKNTTKRGIFAKAVFDGYDFEQTDFGQILVAQELWEILKPLNRYNESLPISDFVNNCPIDTEYIGELGEKYNVRRYKLKDYKNYITYGKNYIMFHPILDAIFKVYPEFKDIEFYVCPSYNNKGMMEDVGFRIVNPEIIDYSFKWTFSRGNNIIYGKNTVNKEEPCYIVEGFRDYVAMHESGFNCIGLGSVEISSIQNEFIKELKNPILMLDNDFFGLKKVLEWQGDKAMLIQTVEKDAWDTYAKGIKLKLCSIK